MLRKVQKIKKNYFEIWPRLNPFNRIILYSEGFEILRSIIFNYASKHVSLLDVKKNGQET